MRRFANKGCRTLNGSLVLNKLYVPIYIAIALFVQPAWAAHVEELGERNETELFEYMQSLGEVTSLTDLRVSKKIERVADESSQNKIREALVMNIHWRRDSDRYDQRFTYFEDEPGIWKLRYIVGTRCTYWAKMDASTYADGERPSEVLPNNDGWVCEDPNSSGYTGDFPFRGDIYEFFMQRTSPVFNVCRRQIVAYVEDVLETDCESIQFDFSSGQRGDGPGTANVHVESCSGSYTFKLSANEMNCTMAQTGSIPNYIKNVSASGDCKTD